MRILLVSQTLPYLPCHDEGRLLASHLLAELGGRHEVGVVAPLRGADTPFSRQWTAARAAFVTTVAGARWRHPLSGAPAEGLAALQCAVVAAAERFAPDVLHLDGAMLAPLARLHAVPTVLWCPEAPALRARHARRLARTPWEWMRAQLAERLETEWQRRWFGALDACVVVAEDDRAELAPYVGFERIDSIAPGIDPRQYAFRRAGDAGRLVFAGAFGARRDVDAARRLATAILPRVRRYWPRAELVLAGPDAGPAVRALGTLPGVRVTGAVADFRPTLWSAGVYVSPLDSGIGATARLLEALALGTPVVASHRSLSGLPDVLPGHHVLAADSDDEFADAVLTIMREPVIANTVAHNARQLVERCHTWTAVAARYEAVYARLTPSAAPARQQVAA